MDDSLVSRCNNYLAPFRQRLKEFQKFTPIKVKTKEKKKIVYDNATKLYSKLLDIYYDDYDKTRDEEKEKYNPNNILIKGQKIY